MVDKANLQASDDVEISIVMPCLNEEETLAGCIAEAQAAIRDSGVSGEIVVADNGSGDNSREVAREAGARVVEVAEKGYGSALIGGIQAARGTYILMGDADGSYDFGELPKFLGKLRDGAELVMGCRLPEGGGVIQPGAMPWLHRWIGNPILTRLGKLFFQDPADDFHCGLRAFHRQSILDLDLCCTGMEFASEMLVKSSLAALTISQIPVTLRPDRRSRAPHLRSWRDGWRHLRFMLLFSPKWLFFMPGLFLFSLGMIGSAVLLQGPVTFGAVTFDTNTLLVCAALVIVGMQILFFAIFTKAYAVKTGLLPPDKRISRIMKAQPVELGIAGGILLSVIGLAYLLSAVLFWRDVGFGDLPYSESLRIVIPSVTVIALGVQCIFFGFVLAIIDLPRKNTRHLS